MVKHVFVAFPVRLILYVSERITWKFGVRLYRTDRFFDKHQLRITDLSNVKQIFTPHSSTSHRIIGIFKKKLAHIKTKSNTMFCCWFFWRYSCLFRMLNETNDFWNWNITGCKDKLFQNQCKQGSGKKVFLFRNQFPGILLASHSENWELSLASSFNKVIKRKNNTISSFSFIFPFLWIEEYFSVKIVRQILGWISNYLTSWNISKSMVLLDVK